MCPCKLVDFGGFQSLYQQVPVYFRTMRNILFSSKFFTDFPIFLLFSVENFPFCCFPFTLLGTFFVPLIIKLLLQVGSQSFHIWSYRKNSCISRTFLLKFWAQNRGCGLCTRPLLSERVKWLVSKLPFVYYCVVTKQMFVIELRLIFVQTSTFSLPLWASAVKTSVVSRKN